HLVLHSFPTRRSSDLAYCFRYSRRLNRPLRSPSIRLNLASSPIATRGVAQNSPNVSAPSSSASKIANSSVAPSLNIGFAPPTYRSEEHTSALQSRSDL